MTNFHSNEILFFTKMNIFFHTLLTPFAAKSTTSNEISVRKPFSSNFIFPVIPFASN
jgi:cytochrome c biogenesis factor